MQINLRSLLHQDNCQKKGALFLLSFLALYFELIVIRWLSSEIRVFAYLKNLPLIASFLGLGVGCAMANSKRNFFALFPGLIGLFCLIVSFSQRLGITFLPFPIGDYLIVGDVTGGFDYFTLADKFWALGKFLSVVLLLFGLCAGIFLSLGQKLGQLMANLPPLIAYLWNILGSLLGVVVFSVFSYWGIPPVFWFVVGFAGLLGFYSDLKRTGFVFVVLVLTIYFFSPAALWSPYYRIDLSPILVKQQAGTLTAAGYNLSVNHDYHQRMLDLAESAAETPFSDRARIYYGLPYRFVSPKRVLIVGAGSGNDAAAALRNGASQVDAVEIDPLIIKLGDQYHPEKPYASPRVRVFNNDARAFFKHQKEKYDLIVFGLLDSQTLLSNMSSIRLDNYIYTLESLREAMLHLESKGTVSLNFALSERWIQERFYGMLKIASNQEPLCLRTPYDSGISYLIGPACNQLFLRGKPDLEAMVIHEKFSLDKNILPVDDWPFLYLKGRNIPFSYWLPLSTVLFISIGVIYWGGRKKNLPQLKTFLCPSNVFLFLLGTGFMLVEVKGINDLSLLCGSTWIVNAIVIAAILIMVLFSNWYVIWRNPQRMSWVYLGLIGSLVANFLIRPDSFVELGFLIQIIIRGSITALPVFFSGILFAAIFKRIDQIPEAFGANLLGALMGGILENLCMIFGVAWLNLLAIAIYGLSAAVLWWWGLKFQKESRLAPRNLG